MVACHPLTSLFVQPPGRQPFTALTHTYRQLRPNSHGTSPVQIGRGFHACKSARGDEGPIDRCVVCVLAVFMRESLALLASPLETTRHIHIGRLNNKRVYETWRKQSTALHETAIREQACRNRATLNISSHLVLLWTMREGQRNERERDWENGDGTVGKVCKIYTIGLLHSTICSCRSTGRELL